MGLDWKMNRLIEIMFAVLLLGAMMPALARHNAAQQVNRVSEEWPIDSFTLRDQHERAFTQEQLGGRWTFLLFGDTRCGEPCAAALSALDSVCRRIGNTEKMKNTQVLFVSLDPEGDTPGQLQKYLAPFDRRFIGATGSPEVLRRLVDDVRASTPAAAQPIGAGKHSYSGSLLLIGPDGVIRAEFLPPFDVLLLTAEYLKTRVRR
jgi:protein SCO1